MSVSDSPPTYSERDEKEKPRVGLKDVEGGHILAETHDVYTEEESGIDPVYQAKARILNDALQEIGMGKYQASFIQLRVIYSISANTSCYLSGGYLSSLALDGSREWFAA